MTIMTRLDTKGLLKRKRDGKTDTYWPRLDRATYEERRAAAEVEQLVEQFGDVALVHFARAMDGLGPRPCPRVATPCSRPVARCAVPDRRVPASAPAWRSPAWR